MAWSGASQADLPTRAVPDQFFGGLVAVACVYVSCMCLHVQKGHVDTYKTRNHLSSNQVSHQSVSPSLLVTVK